MQPGSADLLVLMGSGETSPTMVTVHRTLVAQLAPDRRHGVLLQTPYGFQTNAEDISTKAKGYFARSVGLDVRMIATGDPGAPTADRELAEVRTAPWVFSGPGSPSYALRLWRNSPVGHALADRVRQAQGMTVLASAAAAAVGRFAIPVYEIYKVGETPRWLDGLDLLAAVGLSVAVIPHFDNTEGGTHDTRFCYLGERRLALLERSLPEQTAVLGVDEHTAVIVDLHAGTVDVTGRGGLTVRTAGHSVVLASGTRTTLDEVRALTRGDRHPGPTSGSDRGAAPGHGTAAPGHSTAAPGQNGVSSSERESAAPRTLPEIVADCEQRFATARDASTMVGAILELESAIHEWSADTEEDEGTQQARAVLRSLIVRLGQAADAGLADPREQLAPLVDPLLSLRATLRSERAYPAADAIRDALATTGIQIHDTPAGATWHVDRSVMRRR